MAYQQLHIFATLFFSLSISGCADTQQRLVTIGYRESMTFNIFNDGQQGTVFCNNCGEPGKASFYQITCFNNASSNPSDFTFDISKVIPHPTLGGGILVTSNTSAGQLSIPAGWTQSSLSASTRLVPKGFVGRPPVTPYSFVIIWNSTPAAGQHALLYQATSGQPVVMHQDAVQPEFQNVVFTSDLNRGELTNKPPLPQPSCP